ncbi:hypothetical protein [Tenacibaculum aquimarinum]|uniref:hypothetical protein n=1 Tax=Tenacibaculum aquimarinum TaxID=2910675 RepID=UPI001F0AE849|nr:hypothetical protein [Tenacibaculum aquimarinum]MCH3884401.1 hypothetical protein [Tenacibaculum aquimarinum]
MKIVGVKNGEARSEKTISKIKESIQNWDVTKLGKITQKSLIEVSKVSKNTIEKYYKLFKKEITVINRQFKSHNCLN